MTLSKFGQFPDWMRLLEFSFVANHPKSHAPIAVLRMVPSGYECNESHVVYGIYVQAILEFEPNVCYPSWGDFLDPIQLRELVALIADPVSNPPEMIVQGEAMQFKFAWQDDGRMKLDGHLGNDGWGASYLKKLYEEYPFQKDLRFSCSLTEPSLRNTLDDLQKLLSVVADIEAGKSPAWYEA